MKKKENKRKGKTLLAKRTMKIKLSLHNFYDCFVCIFNYLNYTFSATYYKATHKIYIIWWKIKCPYYCHYRFIMTILIFVFSTLYLKEVAFRLLATMSCLELSLWYNLWTHTIHVANFLFLHIHTYLHSLFIQNDALW